MLYKYACEFTVTGVGQLPMDMLRSDRATPYTQDDVAKTDMLNLERRPIDIRLIRFTEGKGKNFGDHPAQKRWASMGWKVSDVVWRKLY